MLQRPFFAPIVHPRPDQENSIALDLSRDGNGPAKNLREPISMENYLISRFTQNGANMALGGYLEPRNLYNDSTIFKKEKPEEERYIHLGVDIWMPAGSAVFAPLAAKVHSYADNKGYGNYGPTIILEHNPAAEIRFYTLYGHLSRSDLDIISIGKRIEKGQCIGHFGNSDENGNWAPHLHFQIILDMGNHFGDYPGVASDRMLEFEKYNCPDPNIIINCPLI